MTTSSTQTSSLINLTINGKAVAVPKGTTVYHAAIDQGFDLPIFCYQDRMPPFGACRVCLVEVEKMAKLQTSCTLEVTEGMVVNTQSHLAEQGRKDILEFLLINHPLDCPVCDKGGECPLQDQTVKFGPGLSNFYEQKRHFVKAYPLGSLLMLDRERCIVCARCTRFSDLIAGDNALTFVERGYKTEVGTPGGQPVDSKFIGNTIMICPVGALTSDVYRFRARPWDNTHTKTTCTLCPVGCSMILDQRDGEIMRTRSLENKQVNDIWMCDKGWFGYEFASYRARLQKPLIRRHGQLEIASWEEALSLVAEKIKSAKSSKKIAGWGGNPLTTEENFFFQRLIREGGGSHHLDHRIGSPIFSVEAEGLPPGMEMTIGECEQLNSFALLGLDVTEEFPVIWLRLKQALNKGAKGFYTGHYAPEIASHLHQVALHAPGEELSAVQALLAKQAEIFKEGPSALLIGRQYLASPHRAALLSALLKFKQAAPHCTIHVLEGRGNSVGARLAGMHPAFKPFGESLSEAGYDALKVLKSAAEEGWELLYVAGADPAKKYPAKLWQAARAKLGFLVVQDVFMTETARQADVVLPSLCFVEKYGSFVNIAHHVQKLQPGKNLPKGIFSDGEIFNFIAEKLGLPNTKPIALDALQVGRFQLHRPAEVSVGQVPSPAESQLRATFVHALFDKGRRMQQNPHLMHVVKTPTVRLSVADAQQRALIDGETIRVKSEEGMLKATLQIDPKVCKGTVVIPLGFEEILVQELSANLMNGLPVEIEADTHHVQSQERIIR